ncbi:uncharacterized protein N7483_003857 [Penicillium malachiteum]|uniref:uncharacterized protein n=1 Tax=Penicillium malachiteum TaxID=1324776 RepID=UPI002548BA81|nr:uncharacterized protein N7483_003857 [Penicillium malachiteum]KAJ5729349.1 hypothetical protein N7483_003857 [Penicillium malachiteum]
MAGSEGPHPPFHQLLLVLNYLFVCVMLPRDEGAMWCIIYRHSADWEKHSSYNTTDFYRGYSVHVIL